MATSKKNIYALLLDETSPEDEHQETTQTQRKALKKLREISLLKAKPHKTPEEYAKISQESFYQLIADAVDADAVDTNAVDKKDHTIEEARLRKAKKQEYDRKLRAKDKKIAALQAKLQKQEEAHQETKKLFYKTISDQAKTISQQCRKNDEMENAIHMLHNQIKNIKSINNDFRSILFDEYNTALQTAQSTRTPLQVWKKLMLKYHPDKIAHILGTRMSTEITKVITEMKPTDS